MNCSTALAIVCPEARFFSSIVAIGRPFACGDGFGIQRRGCGRLRLGCLEEGGEVIQVEAVGRKVLGGIDREPHRLLVRELVIRASKGFSVVWATMHVPLAGRSCYLKTISPATGWSLFLGEKSHFV